MNHYWRTLGFQSFIITVSCFSVSVVNYIDWFFIHGDQPDEFGAKGVDFIGSLYASVLLSLSGILFCGLTLLAYVFLAKRLSRWSIGGMALFYSTVFWLLLIALVRDSASAFSQMIILTLVSSVTSLILILSIELLSRLRIVNLWPKNV